MTDQEEKRSSYPSRYGQPGAENGKTDSGHRKPVSESGRPASVKRRSVPIIYQDEESGRGSEKKDAVKPQESALREEKTNGTAAPAAGKRPVRETEAEHEARIRRAEALRGKEEHRTADPNARETVEKHGKSSKKASKASQKPVAEEQDLYDEDEEECGKKKRRKGGFFRFLLTLILILTLVEFVVVFVLTGRMDHKPMEPIAEEADYNLPGQYEKGVMNVLLVGTDARIVGEDSRSDSMIILSICPLKHKMYMTSVLRDSYVDIPGYGMNRLNHAYQMGGGRLLIQTIEQNFGIRIDGYAKVDFYSFIEIIDAIGGVDINVSAEELRWLDPYLGEINLLMGLDVYDSWIYEEGVHTLSGRQALAYGRIRYIGTDFGRTNRQRTVLMAALKKVLKTNPVQLFKVAQTTMENITTNMSRLKMTLLIMRIPFLATYRIESDQIPYDNTWWNDTMGAGGEVLGIDLETVRRMFRERVYGR